MLLLLFFLLLLLLLAVGYIKALRGGEGGETRNGADSRQRRRGRRQAAGWAGGREYRADAWPCSEGERRGMVD